MGNLDARLTKLETARAGPARIVTLFPVARGSGAAGWRIGGDNGPAVDAAQVAAWRADAAVVLLTVVYDANGGNDAT